MAIDTITLGTIVQIIEAIGILVGGFVFMLRAGRATGKVEVLLREHHDDIVGLREELKELRPTLVAIAVQKTQIENLTTSVQQLVGWYDELRHGKGFVRESN